MILFLIILCAFLAIGYGIWATKQIMALPEGNEEMRRISGAVREGAMAYLNRQYKTIGMVGAVIFVFIWIFVDCSSS